MNKKESVKKSIIVIATIVICVALCVITVIIMNNTKPPKENPTSQLESQMSNYDSNAVPDKNFAGNWKISSATITDKFNNEYPVSFSAFDIGLNADGTGSAKIISPYFPESTIKQMNSDTQARVDALGPVEKKEYEKQQQDYINELNNSELVVNGNDEAESEKMQLKYRKLFEVNSDAELPETSGLFIENGEWRSNNKNIMIYGDYAHAQFEIQDTNTLILYMGNIKIVLKKA